MTPPHHGRERPLAMPLLPPSTDPGRLGAGDRIPDCAWRDTLGRHFTLEQPAHAGRVSLVFAFPAALGPGVRRELAKLRDLDNKWSALDVQVIAVTPATAGENAALAAKLDLPFPVLSDAGFALGHALGLELEAKGAGAKKTARASAAAIVDPNRRVERLIPPAAAGQAPILILPQVLEPDHLRAPGAVLRGRPNLRRRGRQLGTWKQCPDRKDQGPPRRRPGRTTGRRREN